MNAPNLFGKGSMNSASAKRVSILSRTPTAILSPALLDEFKGADLIIHAGDLTSEMDYEHLRTIAPCERCWVITTTTATTALMWTAWRLLPTKAPAFAVAHYREETPVGSVDVAINGHTYVTKEAHVRPPPGPQPRQCQLSKRHLRPHHGQNARQGRQDSEHQIY